MRGYVAVRREVGLMRLADVQRSARIFAVQNPIAAVWRGDSLCDRPSAAALMRLADLRLRGLSVGTILFFCCDPLLVTQCDLKLL